MKRKLFAVLVTLAMLVGLLPLAVFADTDTTVTNLTATITAPKVGETPDYNPKVVTTTSGVTVNVINVYWFSISEDEYTGTADDNWHFMNGNDTFEEGYYYSPEIYVNVIGGTLAEDATGTINGIAHVNTYGDIVESIDRAYISVVFGPLELQRISKVTATVTEPEVGMTVSEAMANFSVSTPDAAAIKSKALNYYKLAKDEYDGSGEYQWEQMSDDEKFEEGYVYSVDAVVYLNDGYVYSKDVTGTVNGIAHDSSYGSVYRNKTYAKVSVDFSHAHSYEWKIDKEATATTDGSKHEECTICGAKRNENTVIEKTGGNSPKTGDESNMYAWIVLMALTAGAAVTAFAYKRKNNK